MEEIIDCVKFQIEITGLHDKIGAGIVLTGGGALLKKSGFVNAGTNWA